MYSFTQNHDWSEGDASKITQDYEKLITAYGGYLKEIGESMLSAFGEAYNDSKKEADFAEWLKTQNLKEEREYKGSKVYKNGKLILGKKTNNLSREDVELIEKAKLAKVGSQVGNKKQNYRFRIMNNTVLEVKEGRVEINDLQEHLLSQKHEIDLNNTESNPILDLMKKQGLSINSPVLISLNKNGEIEVKKADVLNKNENSKTLDNSQEKKWESQADKVLAKIQSKNTLTTEDIYTNQELSQSLKEAESKIIPIPILEVNTYSLKQHLQEQKQPQFTDSQLPEKQSSKSFLYKHDELIAKQLKVISSLHSGNPNGGLNIEGDKYDLIKIGTDYTLKDKNNKILMKFSSDPSLGLVISEANWGKEKRIEISNDLTEHIESKGLRGSFASKEEKYSEQLKFISDLSKTISEYTGTKNEESVINGKTYHISMKKSGEVKIDDKINNRGTLYIETKGIVVLNKLNNNDINTLKTFKQNLERHISEAKVIQSDSSGSTVSTNPKDIKTNNPHINQQFNIPNPTRNITLDDKKKKKDKDKDKGMER